ncbi:hypothetical protein DQ04_04351000, partial [Trypanosoma grayi]|uniref:hypothetical protein n=1 Tax=Trypanosoma grayi TaxID=71804 RepID=UPI0004F3F4F9
MRPVRFLFSAAATAAPQATKETSKAAAAGKPRRAFAPLRIHPWQAQCLGTSRSELLPQGVLYHGTHLGPRPLIILDHTTKSAAEAEEAAKKYEALLSELAWGHGAVYVPLHVDYAGATRDVLDHSCRQVCAVMDALDVRWTHFLAYSYGCLVAARMAASEEFPHRLGTFTSLDTPLVTREQLNNTQRREDIAKAEKDVNVPEADLAFAKHTLLGSLEE